MALSHTDVVYPAGHGGTHALEREAFVIRLLSFHCTFGSFFFSIKFFSYDLFKK
jgi:hypothetical protein